MRYYIADLHFFHEVLNTKMDRRGFSSLEEMHGYMICRWNEKVRQNDEVVILGDVSWGKPEETNELLRRLNGRLFLITGNHDRFLKHKGYDTSRFVWIRPYEEMKDDKRKVVLCHYPIMFYNGQYQRGKDGNPKTYMLYGHVHDTRDQRFLEQFQEITRRSTVIDFEGREVPIPCQMINCFCMYSDYTPLSLDEWIVNDAARREHSKNI